MSRLFLRRGRILPGPLKVLQQAERRGPVPMASIALTSAVMAAGLVLLPHLSDRIPVDPTPMTAFAEPGSPLPEARASVASVPLVVAATPARAEPVETSPPVPVASVAPAPSRTAPQAPVKQAAATPTKPPVDGSLFQLDMLPVLQAGDADLDTGGVPPVPAKTLPKPSTRRTAAVNRGAAAVAADGPTQP